MNRTLYISDLDGTLLNADAQVSGKSRAMINEAIARGALFSVATARTPATVSRLLDGIDMNLPAVVMTGAALWNPADGTYSDVRFMKPEAVAFLLRTYRDNSMSAFIYTMRDNILHVYHTGPVSPLEQEFAALRSGSPFKTFHLDNDGKWLDLEDPQTASLLGQCLLVYTMQPTPLVETVYRQIRGKDFCRPVFYHDMYGKEIALMEVFAPETNKAEAVKRLKRIARADMTVCFGDNVNDLPMLESADVPVAVSNAVEEVLRKADIVTGPNTEDSVARFILEATQTSNRSYKES